MTLVHLLREQNAAWTDPAFIARALEIPIRYKAMGAEAGGIEALLIPDHNTGFVIVCDPWVPPDDAARPRFRVAHELAHTLFYDWNGSLPRRILSSSKREEDFCDAFAGAMTEML